MDISCVWHRRHVHNVSKNAARNELNSSKEESEKSNFNLEAL